MKQDRFLMGILVGIGILMVLALIVFFTRKDTQTYISEDAPEGVVHNYVVAVLNKDYEKAYSYLADLDHKPTYEEFRDSFLKGMVNPSGTQWILVNPKSLAITRPLKSLLFTTPVIRSHQGIVILHKEQSL